MRNKRGVEINKMSRIGRVAEQFIRKWKHDMMKKIMINEKESGQKTI